MGRYKKPDGEKAKAISITLLPAVMEKLRRISARYFGGNASKAVSHLIVGSDE